jgi:hypothetical protein
MTLSVAIWTAIGLLLLGILKAVYDLLIAPWLYERSRSTQPDINKRLDARSKRDKWATTIFLLLTVAFSIWNIKDSVMSSQITKQEFDALVARVQALENDRPPGALQALDGRLTAVEGALNAVNGALKNSVTHEELKKTRKELEETIEKASAEVKRLKALIGQRGLTQGGT